MTVHVQVRREQEEVRRLQQRTDQAERELGRSSGVRSPHTGVTVGDFIGRINRSNSESTTRGKSLSYWFDPLASVIS